ncbi:DUF418 domain-containing protein [Spiractinospora alimapuensis]|nr:DUF418 domain-containing protein [Spiractinospora alimapuensis]
MLLLIVLSNTTLFLWGVQLDPSGQPVAAGNADRVVQFLMVTLVDVRVYPLFAFLFGYGMMHVFLRQTAAGATESDTVRLLRRRGVWLVVLGFLHAALLLPTDVLGAYGVIGLVLGALLLSSRERALRRWIWTGVSLLTLLFAVGITGLALLWSGALDYLAGASQSGDELPNPFTAAETSSYAVSVVPRLATWFGVTSLTTLGVTAPIAMLLGFWAARRRILEEPGRHLPLLRRVAVGGVSLGLIGALPTALFTVGVVEPPETGGLEGPIGLAMSWPTGLAGGLGYVAVFALVAVRVARRERQGMVTVAVGSVGRRSLSCYLAHSLVMAPILAGWGLGLGEHMTIATMALFAVGTWLVTVVATGLAEHASNPVVRAGPADWLLRRLTYGPPAGRTPVT